jgi:hypothetical protein
MYKSDNNLAIRGKFCICMKKTNIKGEGTENHARYSMLLSGPANAIVIDKTDIVSRRTKTDK